MDDEVCRAPRSRSPDSAPDPEMAEGGDSPRRTIEPTLLQGMLVCQQCGYALYRTSTRTSKRKLYYYRCLGSDAYRHFKGALCRSRPVRQDYLDKFVWVRIPMKAITDSDLIP